MKVIWDPETTKNVGKFILDKMVEQDLKEVEICNFADLHRNTFRNLFLGKPGITFETVIKGLLALEVSLDVLLLDLYPDRNIELKDETKKIKYIQSIIHYSKNQSISLEELVKYIGQHWDETL
jgi:plasmid maintenance system antidote protein VapI